MRGDTSSGDDLRIAIRHRRLDAAADRAHQRADAHRRRPHRLPRRCGHRASCGWRARRRGRSPALSRAGRRASSPPLGWSMLVLGPARVRLRATCSAGSNWSPSPTRAASLLVGRRGLYLVGRTPFTIDARRAAQSRGRGRAARAGSSRSPTRPGAGCSASKIEVPVGPGWPRSRCPGSARGATVHATSSRSRPRAAASPGGPGAHGPRRPDRTGAPRAGVDRRRPSSSCIRAPSACRARAPGSSATSRATPTRDLSNSDVVVPRAARVRRRATSAATSTGRARRRPAPTWCGSSRRPGAATSSSRSASRAPTTRARRSSSSR